MTSPSDLTLFQLREMAALRDLDRPSGQELKRELQSYLESDVNNGRLYQNLQVLIEAGLVEWGYISGRTKWYDITEEGEAVLDRERAYLEVDGTDGG